jgi:hypothetical protein
MKTKDYIIFLLIVLVGVVCPSCSMQKRNYRQGYYIEGKSKEQSVGKLNQDSGISKPQKNPANNSSISYNKNSKSNNSCDTLLFNDGTNLVCKIEEVTKRSVRYKNCTDNNEASSSIDAELVSSIKFYNGRVRSVSQKEAANNKNKPNSNNTLIKASLVNIGLIIAILSVLLEIALLFSLFHVIAIPSFLIISFAVLNVVTALLAIILGFNSLKEIRENPEIFKGKKMAKWVITLGILSLVSWLIILIAITII